MTRRPPMPRVAGLVAAFGGVLRSHGLPATPDQTITFLRGVTLLGPHGIRDIYHAAVATFGPEPEQRAVFDALFRTHFYGDAAEGLSATSEAQEDQHAESDALSPKRGAQLSAGDAASLAELLKERRYADGGPLRDWGRQLLQRLPRRRSFRTRPSPHGHALHMRRSLRQLVRNDGDIARPEMALRVARPRKILILIDVSGSMKALTQDYLRFSHTVVQYVADIEVFTFATRLSAITPALKRRQLGVALEAASGAVDDWDGGTRIGPCLTKFLSVPRYAGFAAGSVVLVISDGMERGDPSEFVKAVRRLSRLAWRLVWATPLAADPDFEPKTRAMLQILPALDALVDGSNTQSLTRMLLSVADPAALRTAQVTSSVGGGRPLFEFSPN
jgi:uncharacterized protein with von Willebrand factor type A (vWA) domain